jgi:hypothetical protein
MIFSGTPNLTVKIQRYSRNKAKFIRFDENGEFETSEPGLIERLKRHYKYDEPDVPEKNEESKVYKCKFCSYQTENKGLLLAHYREHKK